MTLLGLLDVTLANAGSLVKTNFHGNGCQPDQHTFLAHQNLCVHFENQLTVLFFLVFRVNKKRTKVGKACLWKVSQKSLG